jgi:hypothetical protein
MSLAGAVAKPASGVEFIPAFADVYPNVKIGGVAQVAAWPADVYAAPGDAIIVAQILKPDAPAQNVVVSRVGASGPREATVTAAPGGSDTITATAAGTDYTVTFLTSYTPTVGDRVRLLWQGRDATVVGKVGITPAEPAPPTTTPVPPPAATSGTFARAASDSATFSSGYGWNSYYGQNVYQGDGSAYGAASVNNGAWFYAGAFAELAGATIHRVQLRLPARKSAGGYNSAGTIHIYAHTSPNRPGGDVARTAGPFDISIPAGFGGGLVDVPTSTAPILIAGGGFSITGSPYMGFRGKAEDPASGQALIDWSRP